MEGLGVAKRVQELDYEEVKRLVNLVMEKIAEVNKLDEKVYKFVKDNCEKEMHHESGKLQNTRIGRKSQFGIGVRAHMKEPSHIHAMVGSA